jgi:hypothetical protein
MSAFHIRPRTLAKEPHENEFLEKSHQKLRRKKGHDTHKRLNAQITPRQGVSQLRPKEKRLANFPP